MLSKFFPALKPKDYSVQIMKDSTSQSAVNRIKRTRTTAPFKKFASLLLVLSFVGGGLITSAAATAVTAEQAQANIFADTVCISGADDKAGQWNGGANVYGAIGGRAAYSMLGVSRKTVPSDSAYMGRNGTWGGAGAPDGGQFLTAYEKYGMLYPVYDAWVPVFADKEVTIKQVDSSQGSYSTADGKLTTKGNGHKLQAGDSPITTTDVGSCLAFLPAVSAGISNFISVAPRFVMLISIELYGASYGSSMSQPDSILYGLGQSIDKFITQPGGLKDSLFIPFILPLLLIGACWVGYVGIIQRKVTAALQSTLWMIVAIAAGTVFLAQPTLISKFVDETVYQVQGVVNEAVLQNSNSANMCRLDGSSHKVTFRETKCTIWHTTIYSTWVAGQFGEGAGSVSGADSVLKQEADRDILNNQDYLIHYGSNAKNWKQADTWPQFMIDRQVTTKKLELSEVAWAQLSGQGGATINNDWAGNIGMVSSAILMFFGAGASSATLFVYGFCLLSYQLMMISAVLMSPFFFLFGIIPNWGRRVLMRYAEIIASLAVKRIVTATMLAFYLLFYNLVIGDAALGMLLLKMIVIFCLALFFITKRSKFVKMFADNINFGGEKSVGLPGNKATAVAAGLGVGLIGGGIVGGIIAAKKTRKSNADIEGNINTMRIEGGSPTADIKNPPRGPSSGGGGGNNGGNKGENNSGNGGSGAGANPLKTVAKVNNTVRDAEALGERAGQVKDFANTFNNRGSSTQAPTGASNAPTGATPPTAATGASQGASAGTAGTAGATGATSSGVAGAATVGGGAGAKVAPVAAKTAGSFAGSGSGVAAGGAASAAGGAAAGGAAAGGAAAGGAAAGGAAAAGSGVAAGGAAAGGAVAAGAAAGSVVPVIGTAAGAAAAAAAVSIANKKKSDEAKGG